MDVCVSSWNRPAPNTLPQMAKSAANYMNSQLIRMEARANGYVEGIALDTNGYVSEGSGENIFLVHDGTVITPPLANSALPGITRHTVITICRDLGIPVVEQIIPREMLYIVDEVFFCGTAVEITPIRSVDRIKIGIGARGPITNRIQDEFFALPKAKNPTATTGSPQSTSQPTRRPLSNARSASPIWSAAHAAAASAAGAPPLVPPSISECGGTATAFDQIAPSPTAQCGAAATYRNRYHHSRSGAIPEAQRRCPLAFHPCRSALRSLLTRFSPLLLSDHFGRPAQPF